MVQKRILSLLLIFLQIIALTNPFLHNPQTVNALTNESRFTSTAAASMEASPITTGPLRVSSGNPRYLADANGKIVFLAGSNYWNLFQDGGRTNPPPAFNFDAFIQFAVAHGYNYMKPHVWEQAWHQSFGDDWYTQPTIYKRTGPGTALDGGPKFDLNQFNDAYFNRLRARVIQAGQAGIYVALPFFDRFSIRYGNTMTGQWLGHPFHASNNINGINGDPTNQGEGLDTETLIIPAVTAYQEAYVRHTIDVLNDLDNVIWEVAVEPDGTYSRNGYNAQGWLNHFLDYIHNYEATKPKQHPVLNSVFYPGGNNDALFASTAEMIAPNGDGGFDHDAPVLNGSKVVLIDTDHILWLETNGEAWAWKAFTRGAGGFAIMDGGYSDYDDQGGGAGYNETENFRFNLGWIRNYANRMKLAAMTPQPALCSTGYCLANAGSEYLAYLPVGGSINMNLTAVQGTLSVEWFNPATGATTYSGTVNGGATRTLRAPFGGDAVLYLGLPPNIDVLIGGQNQKSYYLAPKTALVDSYPSVVNGPVKIKSSTGDNIFASQRTVYQTSFSEIMGYPANRLTTEYWFPWYDHVYMRTWILIGNPSTNQTAEVDVYIGKNSTPIDHYSLLPGSRVTPEYPNILDGPVRVVSTNGVNIFSSERVTYQQSVGEIMGYPANQFTTEYWFPWYDHAWMRSWIVIGNPSTNQTAQVDVYIGSNPSPVGHYSIEPKGRVTPEYNNVLDGPVRVVSTNGVNIFSSQRVTYQQSVSEVMGYPANQFTTEYFFPWYDRSGPMKSWIVIGNPTSATAEVDLYIGNMTTPKQHFSIPGKGRVTPAYQNLSNGPVRVVSTNGVNIFSSERVTYTGSVVEVMGYPGNRLTSEYWFTWYDNFWMSTNTVLGRP